MPNRPWLVLCVDDEKEFLDYLEGAFHHAPQELGSKFEVTKCSDFGKALELLEETRFDLLVLDVREGEGVNVNADTIGKSVLQSVKAIRFIPVIFFTGVPQQVSDLESPLVKVVEKTSGTDQVVEEARNLIRTGIPSASRAVLAHFEQIQRDYMWHFVEQHWNDFADLGSRAELALLLARRISVSLSSPDVIDFSAWVGESEGTGVAKEKVHPLRYYVIPTISGLHPHSGYIFEGAVHGEQGFWILLTPSCDLVPPRIKADHVLLARCLDLTTFPELTKWRENPTSNSRDNLVKLIENRGSERYYFLPGNMLFSDKVIDLQKAKALPQADLASLKPVAALDTPFSSELQVRFARYFGRVGSPDIDADIVMSKLQQ